MNMLKSVTYLLLIASASSFAPHPNHHGRFVMSSSLQATVSRRDVVAFGFTAAGVLSTTLVVPTSKANAASAGDNVPTKEDLERLKLGHAQVVYLLDNFEKETTVCRENGGECKRDSDAVRRALGLRSTTDPLFQIEKVFAKVKNMDLDPDKLDAFFEATEDWNTAMNMSNSMAFISQFGEYNPGGGKDAVLKYLEEARTQVILAEKALKTILDCLDIA